MIGDFKWASIIMESEGWKFPSWHSHGPHHERSNLRPLAVHQRSKQDSFYQQSGTWKRKKKRRKGKKKARHLSVPQKDQEKQKQLHTSIHSHTHNASADSNACRWVPVPTELGAQVVGETLWHLHFGVLLGIGISKCRTHSSRHLFACNSF